MPLLPRARVPRWSSSRKSYRLDWRKSAPYQIALAGATNITLVGNGDLLVNHPRNNLISLKECSGVSVKGFTVDYDPLPFTQGTITEVNAREGWIDVRIHKGYWIKKVIGPGLYRKLDQLRAERDRVRAQLEDAKRRLDGTDQQGSQEVEEAISALRNLGKAFENADPVNTR